MNASLKLLTLQLDGHLHPPETDEEKAEASEAIKQAIRDIMDFANAYGLETSPLRSTPGASPSRSRTRAERQNVRTYRNVVQTMSQH